MRKIVLRTLAVVLAAVAPGCGNDNPAGPGEEPGPDTSFGFETFQSADLVIGQVDLVSGAAHAGGTRNAAGVSGPYSAGAGSYYVADTNSNRVLGFDRDPDIDGPVASFVIGQNDFTSAATGATDHNLAEPTDVAVDGGRLFVADRENNRVLIWNTLPASNARADVVVGQPDFTSSASGLSASALYHPERVTAVGGRLFVADKGNNRILIWNAIPTGNGAPADLVIGQPDFTSNTPGLSAADLNVPDGLWTDGTRLVVSDEGNNRVMIWNTIPSSNHAPADLVLGAPDVGTAGSGAATATTLTPGGIASDGSTLFVADAPNHRVLMFAPFPTRNGVAATAVLGQGDFTHSMYDDANQDGQPDAHPTARTFNAPIDVKVIGDRLFVADSGNNRILVFSGGSR